MLRSPAADIATHKARTRPGSRRVAAAAAIPRELRTATRRPLDPAQYTGIGVPTLLLDGENSPAGQRAAVAALARAVPAARVVMVPGQAHSAQLTAPELVTEALLEFLRAR